MDNCYIRKKVGCHCKDECEYSKLFETMEKKEDKPDLKRYYIHIEPGNTHMVESADGAYCEYEDVENIQSEYKHLKEERDILSLAQDSCQISLLKSEQDLEKAKELLKEVIDADQNGYTIGETTIHEIESFLKEK